MIQTTDFVTMLSAQADPTGSMWGRFVAPFFEGSEPYLRKVDCPGIERVDDLVDIGSVVASVEDRHSRQLLASTQHAELLVQHQAGQTAHVWLRARTPEGLVKAAADVEARLPLIPEQESLVEVDFWQLDGCVYSTRARVDAPAWVDLRRNYPAEVLSDLDRLRTRELELDGGRIVVWHGPPGTGKTSAIRALARAWEGRVRVQVLLDPERILASSGTLMEVLVAGDTDAWRLLVVEDADELLRTDTSAQAERKRLLDIGDGFAGQGVRVLVLVTTNRPLSAIDPAVVRPGRCLMHTEFRRFERAEARRLVDHLPSGATFSLAELSALRRGEPLTETATRDEPPGQYL